MFYNKQQDKQLGIRTTGINRLSPKEYPDNFQTESTDYYVLDELFKEYQFQTEGRFVDFGCGKGRVLFYVNYHFKRQVVGIELNPTSYRQLEENRQNYLNKYPHAQDMFTLYQGYAEGYAIDPLDTIFYFFNPFALNIVKQILKNIMYSIETHPRSIEIIFYYPNYALDNFIEQIPQLKLHASVAIQGTHDKNDIINIYKNI